LPNDLPSGQIHLTQLKFMKKIIIPIVAAFAAVTLLTGCLRLQFGGGSTTVCRTEPNPRCQISVTPNNLQPLDEQSYQAKVADLTVRLNAAGQISSFSTRDKVLAAIAADAAALGNLELTRNAVQKISSFSTRDEAIVRCAQLLKNGGRRAEALELAKLVSSFSTRDNLISELAK
jgi:hypothetical protein